MSDFRAALVALRQAALYSSDLSLLRQRYRDLQMHSLVDFYDATLEPSRNRPA